MSDSESDGSHSSPSKKEKKSKKSKKKANSTKKSSRGRDREKSRSPSRMRASTGKKKTATMGDLTVEEMADRIKKFGKLTIDERTGAGSLEIIQKRLMPEDVEIILELFRRFTEMQHVRFQRCFMTDDILKRIVNEGLCHLRHLKSLFLPFNMLSDSSADLIIESFAKLSRQLQHLDCRSNTFSEEKAADLYGAFPAIQTLNEIPVYRSKRDTEVTAIDLNKKSLKLADIKILVCLLQDVKPCHITHLDLSNNGITASALRLLAEGLINVSLQHIILDNNPLTDGDLDYTGMEALFITTHRYKHICSLSHAGVEFPEEYRDRLATSLAVNRSLYVPKQKESDGLFKDRFSTFIHSVVEERTPALPENAAEFDRDAIPDFKIDSSFYNVNRLPTIDVKMDATTGSMNRGFDISFIRDPRQGRRRFDAMA